MSNDSGFPTEKELAELNEEDEELNDAEDIEGGDEEPEEVELRVSEPEAEPSNKDLEQETIFELEMEEPKKPKKKKRQLSEKQLAALAKAREKGLAKRRALKRAKEKERELKKLEKTAHIRAKKQKRLEEEALILAHAQEEHEAKEKAAWDEEKLVNLMNRTMDTYFEKRQQKKREREHVPAPPQGYYVPAMPPPQRYIEKEVIQKPKKPKNPYYSMFGQPDRDWETSFSIYLCGGGIAGT